VSSVAATLRAPASRGSGTRLSRHLKVSATTALLVLAAAVVVVPIYWLVIASSKSTAQLFSTSTFLPPSHLSWGANFRSLFSYGGGYFGWWLLNSFIYSTLTATLATAVSTLCGYGLAKYTFKGKGAVLGLVLGSFVVPSTALVLPIFLLEHFMGLTNTYEGVVLPLVVYPFGVYFMSIYCTDAVPDTLIDSSRMDGAGELRTLWQVARPVLMPGMVTLFLLSFIGSWNNFFLPFVLLGSQKLFPVTVGLEAWSTALNIAGAGQPLYPEVILGSLVSVLPMLVLFPFLQKYVARGLTFGAVAGE
jgi:multiple sugar transport system permease protein